LNKWLQEVERTVVEHTTGMSEDQLIWHPEGKWCTADILEHLSLTYSGTRRAFEKVVAAGKPLATQPSVKQRLQIWLVTSVGYFPEGRKSPKVVHPTC
jgi:hypothetical protein